MGVVKQQLVLAALFAVSPDAPDQIVVVPLVHNDGLGTAQRAVEIQLRGLIGNTLQARISRMKSLDGCSAGVLEQVHQAPAICRLIDRNFVAPRLQLPGVAAQEMGVAVVPVGNEGMIKQRDLHRISARNAGRNIPRRSESVLKAGARRDANSLAPFAPA